MILGAKKLRDTYKVKPDAPFYMREFGYYSLERWATEGHIPSIEKGTEEAEDFIAKAFQYDEPGNHNLGGLGWCEAGFEPVFETKLLEDLGDYELVQDFAGRGVLYFKGRRDGFMPEYRDHPVKDMKTWEENCKWRMDPLTPSRYTDFESRMAIAKVAEGQGRMITMNLVGGYMYLRSLMGPEELLYNFYDQPELIISCMEAWFNLADHVIEKYQENVSIDELFLAEDICYNHGLLISPDMVKEFLFPYYEQLYANIKKRNKDKGKVVYLQIDSDGDCLPAIELYRTIGADMFSPFEVASGGDVVAIGKQFPDLIMLGGIDKRKIAVGGDELDRHLDAILPIMRKRGGYIPTCDHGVPEEVSFENFAHYRKRLLEYSK